MARLPCRYRWRYGFASNYETTHLTETLPLEARRGVYTLSCHFFIYLRSERKKQGLLRKLWFFKIVTQQGVTLYLLKGVFISSRYTKMLRGATLFGLTKQTFTARNGWRCRAFCGKGLVLSLLNRDMLNLTVLFDRLQVFACRSKDRFQSKPGLCGGGVTCAFRLRSLSCTFVSALTALSYI